MWAAGCPVESMLDKHGQTVRQKGATFPRLPSSEPSAGHASSVWISAPLTLPQPRPTLYNPGWLPHSGQSNYPAFFKLYACVNSSKSNTHKQHLLPGSCSQQEDPEWKWLLENPAPLSEKEASTFIHHSFIHLTTVCWEYTLHSCYTRCQLFRDEKSWMSTLTVKNTSKQAE